MPHTREVTLTLEADGAVATCDTCGWLRWEQNITEARKHTTGHKCRKGQPCLKCRREYRLGDSACRHYMSDAGRAAHAQAVARAREAVAR